MQFMFTELAPPPLGREGVGLFSRFLFSLFCVFSPSF